MKTLKILAVGDPAVYGYTDKSFKIIDKYEQMENINVQFDIIEWKDYYDKLLKSFLKYDYDIVMVAGHLWLQDFVNKGFLEEIKSTSSSYDYDDILPSIRNEIELNGKMYLLPSFCDGHMLCYRSDEISIKTKENISILDTIRLVNSGDTCLKAHPSELFLDFLPYLRGYGNEPFLPNGKLDLDEDKTIKALEHYKKMINVSLEDTLNFGNGEVLNAIQKNDVKLAVSWGGQIGQILNEECVDKDSLRFLGLKESWNVTWSFAIPKISKKYEESIKFLEYITSKEVDVIIGKYCGNPTRLSTFENEKENNSWYPSLLNMLNTAKPLPNLPNTGELIGSFTESLVEFVEGRLDAKETVKYIKEKISLKG